MAHSTSNAPAATLTGVLERIIFLNEENHDTIAEFRPDEKSAPPSPSKSTASATPAPPLPRSLNLSCHLGTIGVAFL